MPRPGDDGEAVAKVLTVPPPRGSTMVEPSPEAVPGTGRPATVEPGRGEMVRSVLTRSWREVRLMLQLSRNWFGSTPLLSLARKSVISSRQVLLRTLTPWPTTKLRPTELSPLAP